MRNLLVVLLSIFLLQCAGSEDKGYQNSVELKTIHERNKAKVSIQESKTFSQDAALIVKPGRQDNQLLIWQEGDAIDWDKANYLVCEIYHTNDFSGVININFFKKGAKSSSIVTQGGQSSTAPHISAKIGVLPELKTKLIFPS